ncbi:MAG: sigma-70 family RNA polymerase sigma factor [Streptosporangiaceae bacterium]|nr:sigma-70 family RNA polymerase sigma factor [Streptosporangiaceae bacterium]
MPTTLGPARPAASSSDGARPGTGEMLATLYADYGSDLRRFAARLTGDHGCAEDIVQETMLRAWRYPDKVGGRTGAPRAWLYAVAHNLAIDQHRARRARPAEAAGLAAVAGRTAPDQIDAAITQWDLASALAGLRPCERDLLAARYLRDRSIKEIAADLNVPAGTIKSRLSAARDALRRILQSKNSSTGPRQATAWGAEAVVSKHHRGAGEVHG